MTRPTRAEAESGRSSSSSPSRTITRGVSKSLAICKNLSFFIVYPTFRSIDFYIYDTLFYFFCQCAWGAGKKFHNCFFMIPLANRGKYGTMKYNLTKRGGRHGPRNPQGKKASPA